MSITEPEAAAIAEIRRLCAAMLAPLAASETPLAAPSKSEGDSIVAATEGSTSSSTSLIPAVSSVDGAPLSGGSGGAVGGPAVPGRKMHVLSDYDVVRFLRARKGDVAQAAEALKKTLAWRETSGADEVLAQPFPDFTFFRIFTPHGYHKFDREGHPVYFERSGSIDVAKVLHVIDEDALIVRHIWQMEVIAQLCREATAAQGRPINKAVYIFDLKNLSLSPNSVAMALFKATLHMDQNFYPERLHKAFFINSPWIFQGLWAVISPWIDPVTKAKFRILGSDYKDALLEIIAPENLPAEYGGTCTCGMTVEAGQPRTETCVSPVCALTLPQMLDLAGFRPLALAAGAESTVHLDVAAADGSVIVWYWNADDKDVLCQITFTPVDSHAGGATLYILTESKLTRHKGWFVPPSAGRLALRFSNKHSRFTSKTVQYRLSAGHSEGECRVRSLRPFTEPKGDYVPKE